MREQKLREGKQVTQTHSEEWQSPTSRCFYSLPFCSSAFYVLNITTKIWTTIKRWVWWLLEEEWEWALCSSQGNHWCKDTGGEGILFKGEQGYYALSIPCDDAGKCYWKRHLDPLCSRSYLLRSWFFVCLIFVRFLFRSFDLMLKALASQWRLVFDNGNSDVHVEGELDAF